MPNQTTNDKHYECETCANINSPLCDLCTRINSPSGKERKPKYYIEFSKVTSPITQIRFPLVKNKEFKRQAITIARYLCNGKPIPTSVVMKYNELAAKEKAEE
jgi:hypothetical protein